MGGAVKDQRKSKDKAGTAKDMDSTEDDHLSTATSPSAPIPAPEPVALVAKKEIKPITFNPSKRTATAGAAALTPTPAPQPPSASDREKRASTERDSHQPQQVEKRTVTRKLRKS
mmetsp:Transcript_44746/g.72854  ORF Transcript_44746/g.72854 Transcript_44746/m.72854 type:complete len:115 (+) Transcript_44746:1246-1590(+)